MSNEILSKSIPQDRHFYVPAPALICRAFGTLMTSIFEWLAWCCAVQNSETEGDGAGRQRSLQQAQGLLPFHRLYARAQTSHALCLHFSSCNDHARLFECLLKCFTHCRKTAHTAVLGARHLSTREWTGQPPTVFVTMCNILYSSACDMRFLLRTAHVPERAATTETAVSSTLEY